MPKVIENRLIEEFKETEAFSREELYSFYKDFEPDIKEGTLGWRIYDLKKKNIIKSVRRGWYSISPKPFFKPETSSELLKLSKGITEHFKDLKYCIWETPWLNEFLQHQTSKQIILIEIEKGFEQDLYFQIKNNFKHEVYLNPQEKEIDLYITESQKSIVIKKMITRSPVSKQTVNKNKFVTPQLEKILVDIFADEKLFYFYHGSELTHLFENAIERYSINYTRLFSYAKRRDKEEGLKAYLDINLKHVIMDIRE